MKADLTRNTFHPLKQFTSVLMQQGRVQLDADWNEQAAILLSYIRALAEDLIGPDGGPQNNLGFGISPAAGSDLDFVIGGGHYYVNGILCQTGSPLVPITISTANSNQVIVPTWIVNGLPFVASQPQQPRYVEIVSDSESTPSIAQITNAEQAKLTLTLTVINGPALSAGLSNPQLRSVITYMTQPDYPVPSTQGLIAGDSYQIYLDVWERLITFIEDDSIREVALGGAETAARARLICQVKQIPATDNSCLSAAALQESLQPENRGWLKAVAGQKSISTDPCVISPQASYRGPENQLYRVEIHSNGAAGSTPPPTFKWSRENGSVVLPILAVASGSGTTTVTLENLGRDDRFGLREDDWVEIQDDDYVLQNRAEPLLQVQSISRSNLTVTLKGAPASNVGQAQAKHPLLRRWDHVAGDPAEGGSQLADDGAIPISEGADPSRWLNLEDSIQIQFQPATAGSAANQYRTGDYWLIPARTATGDIDWPRQNTTDSSGNITVTPIAKPPDGVVHHYAPLAVLTQGNANLVECRKQYTTLVPTLK